MIAGAIHRRNLPLLVDRALDEAKLTWEVGTHCRAASVLNAPQGIDAISFTQGPGLSPCLAEGLAIAVQVRGLCVHVLLLSCTVATGICTAIIGFVNNAMAEGEV